MMFLSFLGCEKDPCEMVVCENDGHCANGECVCPEGFTGADCSQQVTPTMIRISNITVTKFPQTEEDGGGWDLTSGPDIYPAIYTAGDDELWSGQSDFSQNADATVDYDFEVVPAISLNDPNSQYIIRLHDYDDFDPDDFMGGISFTPYSSTNGFPTSLHLDAGGAVAFTLEVSYVY